jgi:Uma2 family endonuclease
MLAESHILNQLALNATAEKRLYYGVSWNTYLQVHQVLGDDSNVRLTFSHGVLEIMSPKRPHEQITRLVDMVVTLLAFELGQNVDNCGAMTLRFESAQRGGEPDSCFYLANEAVVRRLQKIDLQVHPPPDIVLEVDITNPSLDKFGLYVAGRIPEVWRFDGLRMSFYALVDEKYEIIQTSLSFPTLTAEMLESYLRIGREQGSATMLKQVKLDIPR